ncbi:MAG: histidine kinase [Chitinophagaceae bacterium]|nr:histidine kinase [Chitinophagaceae bacterium]
MNTWRQKRFLLYKRWPWHALFWTGYVVFRLWPYYITLKYYKRIYLEYMLLSEVIFVFIVYFTLWLYRSFFETKKFFLYFLIGAVSWTLYLYGKTLFQQYYLRDEANFQSGPFMNILLSSLPIMFVYLLFITSCKYFKDGYIAQQFEAERKQQQLVAEINNLKSQIAPHFLFNTLNNLYGLAVDKSDKLPGLMLRLSDLLRHSLYETEKPLVAINDEVNVLKSYMELERVRLEDDLKLEFENNIPEDSPYQIAPLILIVFMENAFKHSKLVQSAAVNIYIKTDLEKDWFTLMIRNNHNVDKNSSANGIGLANVKRRLEVLYPGRLHRLEISTNENFYTINLQLQLVKAAEMTDVNGA